MTVLTKDFTPNWICVQCEQRAIAPNVQFISFISVTPKCVKEKRCVLLFYLFIHFIVWLFSDKQRKLTSFQPKAITPFNRTGGLHH